MFTESMMESIKKVEATRAQRMSTEPRRMTAEEKSELLKAYHPDYRAEGFKEIQIGPNKGQKAPVELTDLLHSNSRLLNENIDLSKIDPRATEICFVVTIHKADERRQNFGQVRNSFIRIYNTDTHEEIAKYELEEDFSVETAVEFGRLYKRNGQWKFEAMGIGYKQGLAAVLDKYN